MDSQILQELQQPWMKSRPPLTPELKVEALRRRARRCDEIKPECVLEDFIFEIAAGGIRGKRQTAPGRVSVRSFRYPQGLKSQSHG